MSTSDINYKFILKAIAMAEKSYEKGAFPAGAVLVQNNKIIAKSISAKWPEILFHAESRTIDKAMNKLHMQLTDCILYTSMEPCLMCLSRAYWAGIRKIYYALQKSVTSDKHYESGLIHSEISKNFHEHVELVHVPEFQTEALDLVKRWERENL